MLAAEKCLESGQLEACVRHASQARELAPDDSALCHLLGEALHRLGRLPEAAQAYEAALIGAPDSFELLNNLGTIRLALGQLADAYRLYKRAVAMAPGNAAVRNNLGVVLRQSGYPGRAAACFRDAIAIDPRHANAFRNLGNANQDLGEHQAAIECYQRALAIKPDFAEAFDGLLFCLSHDEKSSPDAVFRAHRAYAQAFEEPLLGKSAPHSNRADAGRRIRLGFVSADLRSHPVANFIEPIWQHLDRKQFEIFAYANQSVEDETSKALKALADHWRNVMVLGDDEFARLIRRDEVDILFDLSGHTAGNRLRVFARKPAPIQISWIGYSNTTGLSSIDYRLVDEFVAPPGLLDAYFSEKLLYAPSSGSFLDQVDAPELSALPALSSGRLSFASFHRGNKLSDGAIALWSRVLAAVPDSRMLIGACGEALVQDGVAQKFALHGISRERLTFRPKVSMNEYLAMHHEIDIHLDSFPFTSGTTANHALWMGVPTLTLAGATMPQRLSAAHLGRVGLHDWITETADDYVSRAIFWSNHLDELAALRASLRSRVASSPLRQAATVTRGLEKVLREVWQQWCEAHQQNGK